MADAAPGMASDMDVLETALGDFQKAQREHNDKLNTVQRRINDAFLDLDMTINAHRTQIAEYDRLKKMLQASSSAKGKDAERHAEIESKLRKEKQDIDAVRRLKSATDSVYIRLIMGKINVLMWKKGDIVEFKDEYNKFKYRTTWLFMLFPLLQLLYPSDFLWKLHQVWLLYYYSSLSLRENILKANGSNIENWWIVHHYLSMAVSTISLCWPADTERWINQFLMFCLAQGFVMYMQNIYQSKRHYVRKSLGKANELDVASTETIVEKPTDLKILVPLLYALFAFEIIFGFYVFYLQRQPEVFALGVIFIALGVGNSVTTSRVLLKKKQERATARRNKAE